MNFNPRMESRISGFTVVGDLRWRIWNGVVADLWDVACDDGAEGFYVSPDPRLFVLLETERPDGRFDAGNPGEPASRLGPLSMSFVPAGTPLVARAFGLGRIRHLDLHFSENAVRQRFGRALDPASLTRQRLTFSDDRIAALARLIATECAGSDPSHRRYGEGLVDALLTLLFAVQPERTKRRAELSRRQLAQVTAFLETHCFETIRLADLAAMIDLERRAFRHIRRL